MPAPLPRALSALKRFADEKPPAERCDLCGQGIAARHDHLLSVANRKLDCACQACATLFVERDAGKFLRVQPRCEALPSFSMSDSLWEELSLPVQLAFFVKRGKDVVAAYPGPAGATEAPLSSSRWASVVAENPRLATLQDETEALLVQGLGGGVREGFLVSIDEPYALVGLLRKHWRGLSGGDDAWREVKAFFERLRKATHA